MSTHTPSPWKALIDWPTACFPGHLVKACDEIESPICAIPRSGNRNSVADAKLIAAAPELLEILKAILPMAGVAECFSDCDGLDALRERAQTAIAKAEGREE